MATRCCDICGDTPAPFGLEMPGGRRAQKPGTRPLWYCASPACKSRAVGRWESATTPFKRRTGSAAPAHDPPPIRAPPTPPLGGLFD